MGFNVENYENQYAFTFESETLGRIRIWAATSYAATKALRFNFPRRRDESLRDFMLFLLSITAAQENPEHPRRREEFLPLKRLSAIPDAELETIAAEFLKHHTYLFEGQELTRTDQESNVGYLRRVAKNYCETQNEAALRRIDQMSANLSKTLMPDLSALTQLNSSISNSLDTIRHSQTLQAVPSVSNPQHKTNALLNEVVDIVSRQAEVSERTVLAIDELARLGEAWQQSALNSSQAASRQIRFTNAFAVIMTVLTILALVMAYLTYKAGLSH